MSDSPHLREDMALADHKKSRLSHRSRATTCSASATILSPRSFRRRSARAMRGFRVATRIQKRPCGCVIDPIMSVVIVGASPPGSQRIDGHARRSGRTA